MTADVWMFLGKIAGIGGIAVGAFVLLFREVIRKTVFANLTKRQSFVLLLVIVVLSWSVGVLGIWAWVHANKQPPVVVEVPIETLKSALAQINCCSEWEIKDASVSNAEKEDMLHVLHLFSQHAYEEARQELDGLQESTDFVRRFKKDYRTGIYFAEGRYKEALESVLERYHNLPVSDVRYRWDIAYIIYQFRVQRGLDECEQTIAALKKIYPRADLSPVWMGIQPRAHERLVQGDLYPYQSLHEKQLGILKYVVAKYPKDAFIDHAFYFLKEYDRIIADYPHSLILDRAYYARAYLAYYRLQNAPESANDDLIDSIGRQLEDFMVQYPDNNLADEAYAKLVSLQTLRGNPRAVYVAVQELIERCRLRDPSACSYDSARALTARGRIESYVEERRGAEVEDMFGVQRDNVVFARPTMQRLVALAYFKEQDFVKSWEYYQGLEQKLKLGKGERARIHAIELAAQKNIAEMDFSEAWRVALAFKNLHRFADFGVPYLNRCLSLATSEEEHARVLMTKGFTFRNAEKPEEMVAAFRELVFKYPQSELADDALAEIGVYYMLWGQPNYDEALKMFNEVITRYPNGNAVDNSYNWAAYIMRTTGNNQQAKRLYEYIRERFPLTRFAKYANNNLQAMQT